MFSAAKRQTDSPAGFSCRQATGRTSRCRALAAVSVAIILASALAATAQVPVRHEEGLVHGFLVLRDLQGETLADGDLIQNALDGRVTSRLIFHFKDGSLHDETAIFTQRGTFRLLSDHLVQKGPAFPHPVDLTVDGTKGVVTTRSSEDGKEKVERERLHLPVTVANGMVLTLLKNIRQDTPETKIPYVVAAPEPRIVQLAIRPEGEEEFTTGNVHRRAMRYVVKTELGGMSGVLASVLGEQPPDIHVWILEGRAPTFIRSEGPLAPGGPIWRVELADPVWPHSPDAGSAGK